jgi:hypothetical protein
MAGCRAVWQHLRAQSKARRVTKNLELSYKATPNGKPPVDGGRHIALNCARCHAHQADKPTPVTETQQAMQQQLRPPAIQCQYTPVT